LIRIERHTLVNEKERSSVTYAITSLPRKKANAETLLSLLRGRWEIENGCFHVLDATLREDHDRTRTGRAAHVKSVLGHIVLNLARRLRQSVPSLLREHALKPNLLYHRLGIMKN
jgi:predicted transposase YbfD/YdcC